MILDNDTSGIEDAQRNLANVKASKPFTSYWAAKIDGEWAVYNAMGGITRAVRKCETACPTILHGQNVGKAYAVRALRKAFAEAMR
jgi:hypothetical protein